jgi:hypothetical protein
MAVNLWVTLNEVDSGRGRGHVVMNKKDRILGRNNKHKKARRRGVGKLNGEKEKNLKPLCYDYDYSCLCCCC